MIAREDNAAEPNEPDYDHTVTDAQFGLERVVDDVEAVETDGDESEHAYVDVERGRERPELAEYVRPIPALKNRCLKLDKYNNIIKIDILFQVLSDS